LQKDELPEGKGEVTSSDYIDLNHDGKLSESEWDSISRVWGAENALLAIQGRGTVGGSITGRFRIAFHRLYHGVLYMVSDAEF